MARLLISLFVALSTVVMLSFGLPSPLQLSTVVLQDGRSNFYLTDSSKDFLCVC